MMVTATLTLVCCGWLVWSDVTAFDDGEAAFSAGVAVVTPVVVWVVLALVGRARYTRWWRWGLLVPLFTAATLALTLLEVPGRIGWLMSRDAMNQAATACGAASASEPNAPSGTETIGVYTFDHVEREPDGECEFYLLRNYPGVRSGFHYTPSGKSLMGDIDHQYVHLGGHWYYFRA